MIIRLLAVVALIAGCATVSRAPAPAPAPAASDSGTPPPAKPPRDPASTVYVFEGVEVFGSRKYAPAELLPVIGLPKPGTEIDLSQKTFWEELQASKARLTERYGFIHCRYNLGAYPPLGTARVTVDLVDAGDEWRLDFLPEPTGEVLDPDGLIAAWQAYDKEKWALRNRGEIPLHGEGTCRALGCVSNFGHPTLAALEEKFIEGVPRHYDAIIRVLREDKDAPKRMVAASLLVYGTSREAAVAALVPSIRDPNNGVRNEVLRSLGELQNHQQALYLPVEKIADAVWYPSTTDRNKAAWALVRIVESTGTAHRDVILRRSGEMLAMMTSLATFTDHEPALKVLEALSGAKLGQNEAAWRAWLGSHGFPAVAPKPR